MADRVNEEALRRVIERFYLEVFSDKRDMSGAHARQVISLPFQSMVVNAED